MQYLVIAYDGTDPEAPARRQAARAAHLDGVHRMKAKGQAHAGGAILNGEAQMIGSMMVVEFGTEQQLKAWLDSDPYTVGKVWEKVEVRPFRLATK